MKLTKTNHSVLQGIAMALQVLNVTILPPWLAFVDPALKEPITATATGILSIIQGILGFMAMNRDVDGEKLSPKPQEPPQL